MNAQSTFLTWGRSRWLLVAAGLAMLLLSRQASAADSPKPADAQELVADALRAEVEGNAARRRVLLSMALDARPDYSPARWQSGQLFTGGEWLHVEEAQAAAAANPARAEYKALRAKAGASQDGQLALARWCRKNGLEEEAQFHWSALLTFDPNNNEALRALGVRWFAGRLMTKSEIAAAKEQIRQWQEATKAYAPQVARWERLLAAGDLKSRDKALGEIRALCDLHVIPALEEITLDRRLTTNDKFERSQQISEAFLTALNAMPEQAATASLVRHAVFAPLESIRNKSMASLRQRPLHDFVPMLLSALAMPVESSYRLVTDTDGSVHYFHSLYREGPQADWSFEGRLSAMQHDLQGPVFLTIDDRIRHKTSRMRLNAANNPIVRAEIASVAGANQRRLGGQALAAEQQVAAANRATAAVNALAIPVLTATTGNDFGDDPLKWWKWWSDYNEYSSDDEKPVQEQSYADATHYYHRPPRERYVSVNPPPPRGTVQVNRYRPMLGSGGSPGNHLAYACCFAAGTKVWTSTGLAAIESLEIGDLVLAQNVDTGELAYKPILGRTERPARKCVKLSVGNEPIVSALGHPLWVAGGGWRMAKELGDGAILHGINGPVSVDNISATEDTESYNLVVADFNTYFVGKSGVLVHDNTPRQPTTSLVPGLTVAASTK